ncbi:META domain-containing protein [Chlorobium sp. BLA1]|uniref:META domain-containing protein n=1 Tax=Candidatus Chlorobium masyuteum TaxID=2716876 RepID=UPI0014204740|nr:META domain-containing protein [Candidatus Chlorobium masyuteum]NHQ59504.1 META domain-containing protein [Candidatus Chlorobium masyuteum]NTU45198.1 META domain-containing protein [Chlorobiaceae bacterium]
MSKMVHDMNSHGWLDYRRFAVLLLSMMLLASGCSQQLSKPEQRKPLINTTWRAVEINGSRVMFLPGQKLDVSLVLYASGYIRGYTGCNSFMGSYSRTADLLRLSPADRTEMACSGAIMAREREFIKALRQVARYEISGALLKLFSKDGSKVIELIAVRAS